MAKGHHQLENLIAFLSREAWNEPFEEVLNEHVGHALETLDLDFEDAMAAIGPHWAMTLWGCVFEDFLTRNLEPDGRNLVEDYLRRRGFKETARTKAYMRGLRESVMSLYEVSEVRPGESLLARDLIRGGEPILVREKSATQTLKPLERIAARVVADRDGYVFGGGLLPFSQEASALLLGGLGEAVDVLDDPGGGSGGRGLAAIDDDRLRRLAPLFTTGWLLDTVPKALGEDLPDLRNADGDPLVFHELRFPFAKGVRRDTVARRLGSLAGLQREDENFWNWLGEPDTEGRTAKLPSDELFYEVTMEDGQAVLGNVEIQGRHLVLSVSSAARAERGTALLTGLLGDSLGEPDIRVRTVADMRAERDEEDVDATELPLEIATPLVQETLDRRYRRTLDEPVPMIGGVSPREAVKTEAGRAKVAEWLAFLEDGSSRHPEGDPLRTYDFGWLWRELGIEALRR